MTDLFRRCRDSVCSEKWGRLAALLISIEAVWLWFQSQHTVTMEDRRWIVTGVSFACAVALLASVLTTKKYSTRGLGIFGLFLGLGLLCAWFSLNYWERDAPDWLLDQAAAALLVGAPLLVIGTILAVIERIRPTVVVIDPNAEPVIWTGEQIGGEMTMTAVPPDENQEIKV